MVIRRCPIARRRVAAGLATGLALTGSVAWGTVAAYVPVPPAVAVQHGWTARLVIQYLPGTNHSQYTTVIAGPQEAWFFGGSNIGGHGVPEIEHRIPGRWVSVSLAGLPGLRSWIVAASAQSPHDIWAVTYLGGSVLKWNGRTWAAQPRGGWRAGTQFTGISAVASNSVWLFGAGSSIYPGAGTWHWNGTRWTRVRGIAGGIRRASAASATDIWAIGGIGGSMNALLRLSGNAWTHVTPAALAGFRYSDVFALAPANVWVAGSISGVPKLAHFDGSGWTRVRMPGSVAATGICRNGGGGLWVVANSGTGPSVVRERSAAGHWTTAPVSSRSADEVLACALVPGTRAAWGAGKSAALPGSAAAAYGFGSLP